MKKLIAGIFITLICNFTLKAQGVYFNWAKRLGKACSFCSANSNATDSFGNVYTVGYFDGITDFDPGPGTYTIAPVGATDIYISKLDASGSFLWAKSMGGPWSDEATSIAIDPTGNIYITGNFSGTVDFDPGPGIYTVTCAGSPNPFICKYNSNGSLAWAKSVGGAGGTYGRSIVADNSGNVYVCGDFNGTGDFDPSASVYTLTSAGSDDVFICKLDATGSFLWAKSMGGTDGDLASSIAIDPAGNVLTTGNFFGTADFDPGLGVSNLTSFGSYDVFVSKLNSSGTFIWAKQFGGISWDAGSSIILDGTGNIYSTGYFATSADFDPGVSVCNLTSPGVGVFVSKLTSAGTFVWAKSFVGSAGADRGVSIAIDSPGNIYVCGIFQDTLDCDPGPGTYYIASAGGDDSFINKLDSSGNLVWAKSIGGNGNDACIDIAVYSNNIVYSAGNFVDTCDFDPDAGIYTLTAVGMQDAFILKLSDSNVGLNENSNLTNAVTVFPNPCKGEFTISTGDNIEESSIEIYNALSECVYKNCHFGASIEIDLSQQSNAVYYVHIQNSSQMAVAKLIIQH